ANGASLRTNEDPEPRRLPRVGALRGRTLQAGSFPSQDDWPRRKVIRQVGPNWGVPRSEARSHCDTMRRREPPFTPGGSRCGVGNVPLRRGEQQLWAWRGQPALEQHEQIARLVGGQPASDRFAWDERDILGIDLAAFDKMRGANEALHRDEQPR